MHFLIDDGGIFSDDDEVVSRVTALLYWSRERRRDEVAVKFWNLFVRTDFLN